MFRRAMIAVSVLAVSVASLVLLVACPHPVTDRLSVQIDDVISPVITITSPEEGSYCPQTVVVTGSVEDQASTDGDPGEVGSVRYAILATEMGTDVPIETDGSFSFSFPTTALGTPFVVVITAEDWSGNSTEVALTLKVLEGNDIPSFTATPGNKSVILEWEPVPHTASYDLYYTTNGTLPSDGYGSVAESVTSPYTIAGLANGNMHVFRLKTVSEDGYPDNWSGFESVIPLSEQSLAPVATGEYQEILVEWSGISADTEYFVYRSLDRDTGFVNITGRHAGTSFVDAEVAEDTWYYYRVAPAHSDEIVSVSNGAQTQPFPDTPQVLGSLAIPGPARYLATVGGIVYIANPANGLQIVDVSNPGSPILLATVATPGSARNVAIKDNHAYVADGFSGLQIISITTPGSASIERTVSIPAFTSSVAIAGNYAYVVNGDGLQIVRIAVPGDAELVNTVLTAGAANDVEVAGGFAYVTDYAGGMQVIDVSDPENASATDPDNATVATSSEALYVTVSGEYAYVGVSDGELVTVFIGTPGPPSVVDTLAGIAVGDLDSTDRYVYAALGDDGFSIIDILDPADPQEIRRVSTAHSADGVAVSGRHAFVSSAGGGGLLVLDVGTPASAALARTVDTPGIALSVVVAGDYAYVADYGAGLQVINVGTVPSAAIEAAVPPHGDYTVNAAASGSHVYAVYDSFLDSGLQVVDVGTPAAASVVHTLEELSYDETLHIAVSGSYAYVVNEGGGVFIVVDISVPDSPFVEGTLYPDGMPYDAAVSSGYAYIANGDLGLQIVDISDPASPQVVKTVPLDGQPRAVTLWGSYAIVVNDLGLRVIDVADWEVASLVGSTADTPGYASDVVVSGSYAYVADVFSGIQVVDLSDPTAPALCGVVTSSSLFPRGLAVSGRYLYAAAENTGLEIIDLLGD